MFTASIALTKMISENLKARFLDTNNTPSYQYGEQFDYYNSASFDNEAVYLRKFEEYAASTNHQIIYNYREIEELARLSLMLSPGEYPESFINKAMGYAYSFDSSGKEGKFIFLRELVSTAMKLCVGIHEICHWILGHCDDVGYERSIADVESEAETAALFIRYNIGIDTSHLSIKYINHFCKREDIKKEELIQRQSIKDVIADLSSALKI